MLSPSLVGTRPGRGRVLHLLVVPLVPVGPLPVTLPVSSHQHTACVPTDSPTEEDSDGAAAPISVTTGLSWLCPEADARLPVGQGGGLLCAQVSAPACYPRCCVLKLKPSRGVTAVAAGVYPS